MLIEELHEHRLIPLSSLAEPGTDRLLHELMFVACEDRGEYDWVEQGDERVVVELLGGTFRGRLEMGRAEGDRWRAQFFATAGPGGAAAARGSIAPP